MNGEDKMGAVLEISDTGWRVFSAQSVTTATAFARNQAIIHGLFLLAIAACFLTIAHFGAKQIMRGFHTLREAADKVADGDFTARVEPSGSLEMMAYQAAFNKMVSQIEELEGERIRFLQVAAHELRNPMAAVKGLLQVMSVRMEKNPSPDAIQNLLSLLETEINRLSSLLSEVLETFQIKMDQLHVASDLVNLKAVIEAVVKPFQLGEEVEVDFANSCGDEIWIMGDAMRLQQVLRNLLGNAVKYAPGSEIRMRTEVTRGSVRIAVQDHGPGIPKSKLSRIFDPFYRTKDTHVEPGGLGLGLYISDSIVSRHGGRLWVDSTEGRGTTFFVELPLAGEFGDDAESTAV